MWQEVISRSHTWLSRSSTQNQVANIASVYALLTLLYRVRKWATLAGGPLGVYWIVWCISHWFVVSDEKNTCQCCLQHKLDDSWTKTWWVIRVQLSPTRQSDRFVKITCWPNTVAMRTADAFLNQTLWNFVSTSLGLFTAPQPSLSMVIMCLPSTSLVWSLATRLILHLG